MDVNDLVEHLIAAIAEGLGRHSLREALVDAGRTGSIHGRWMSSALRAGASLTPSLYHIVDDRDDDQRDSAGDEEAADDCASQ